MHCKFIKGERLCHFSKKVCAVPKPKVTSCNYYIRQHPKDKEVFDRKFKRALEKAASRRDIFGKYNPILRQYKVDYSKSIFETISSIGKYTTSPVFASLDEKCICIPAVSLLNFVLSVSNTPK